MRIVARKKVFFLDALKSKYERGQLPPEHRTHYARQQRAKLQDRQASEVRNMDQKHEEHRDTLWKLGVEHAYFSDQSKDARRRHLAMEINPLQNCFPEDIKKQEKEKYMLKKEHLAQKEQLERQIQAKIAAPETNPAS
jgi:hypothetical protein